MSARLRELASTIRSKNAGVDHITFDIIFRSRENFERVRDAGVITRETPWPRSTASASHRTSSCTSPATRSSSPSAAHARAAAGETDVFGSQQ